LHLASMRSLSKVYGAITSTARNMDSGIREATKRGSFDRSEGKTIQLSDWTALLYVAGRDKAISAPQLMALFRDGASNLGLYPTMFAYSVVIRGLLFKWDTKGACDLWKEARQIGLKLDTVSVGNGVAALTLGGEAHNAFALLEEVYLKQTEDAEPQAKVNSYAVHHLMISLQRMGRPDTVFELWDCMEALYGISRDTYTFNIMLKSARWSKKLNTNLRIALETSTLGILMRRLTHAPDSTNLDMSREAISARISNALDVDRRSAVSGLWKGEPAAQVALRVAREVFLGNWPALQEVRAPVKALRQSRDGPVMNPFKDLYDSLTISAVEPLSAARAVKCLLDQSKTPLYKYPEIIPSDVSFRAYFDLLAAEEQIPEIPLALAWMRALGVRPSAATLATALVYFAQVGADAPLIQSIKGGPGSSPYERLIWWMKDWVGEENMPKPSQLGFQARRIDFYWRSDYAKMVEDRNRVTWETDEYDE